MLASLTSLLSASSEQEVQQRLQALAHEIDFSTFSATIITETDDGAYNFSTVHNTPPQYQESYFQTSAGRRDPVMQHMRFKSTPIVWSQDNYVGAGVPEMYEEQSMYGFSYGVATALHMPNRIHCAFGMERPTRIFENSNLEINAIASVQLLATYAAEALTRLRKDGVNDQSERPNLSVRAKEILKWSAVGKTTWEISRILSISERMITADMTSIFKSMNVVTKSQAVARALRLGLVTS